MEYEKYEEIKNLKNAVFYLTNLCNIRCWHCYNDSSSTEKAPSISSLNKIVDIILHNFSFKTISISGGEPLTNQSLLFSIASKFKKNNISLALMTNGLLLSENIMDKICYYFDFIQLSIDYPNDEYAIKYKGVKNYRKSILNTISLLSKYSIDCILTHVPNSGNFKINDYFDELFFSNIKSLKIQLPYPKGRALENQNLIITQKELGYYQNELIKISNRYPNLPISIYFPEDELSDSCSIDYNGNVFTGLFDKNKIGNLLLSFQ